MRHKNPRNEHSSDDNQLANRRLLKQQKRQLTTDSIFANMAPSEQPLPGIISPDAWRHIVSFLNYEQQLESRYWSKAFRLLSLNPIVAILRNSIAALDFDVSGQSMKIENLYIHQKQPATEDDIKRLIMLVRQLVEAYRSHDNYDKAAIFHAFHQLCELIDCKTFRDNIAQYHPLIHSVMIHFIYLTLTDFFNQANAHQTNWYLNNADNLLAQIENAKLTLKQQKRLRIAQSALVLRRQTQPITEQLDTIYRLLNFTPDSNVTRTPDQQLENLRIIITFDGAMVQPEFVLYLLNKNDFFITHIGASYQMFRYGRWELLANCAFVSLLTQQGWDRLDEPEVVRSTSLARQLAENISILDTLPEDEWSAMKNKHIETQLNYEQEIQQDAEKVLSQLPSLDNPKTTKSAIFYDLIERCHGHDDAFEMFQFYYKQRSIRKALSVCVPHVPTWLRSYLYAGDSAAPNMQFFFNGLSLSRLPKWLFEENFTATQLMELEETIRLAGPSLNKKLLLRFHSNELIRVVRKAPLFFGLSKGELLTILENNSSEILTEFVNYVHPNYFSSLPMSESFSEWVFKNITALTQLAATKPDFLRKTIVSLFETNCEIKAERESGETVILTMKYIDASEQSRFNTDYLFPNFFLEKESLLPAVLDCDPTEFFAITDYISNSMRIVHKVKAYADYFNSRNRFSEFAVDCHFRILFLVFFKPIFKILRSKKYQENTYLNWLSRLSHYSLVITLLAQPELRSESTCYERNPIVKTRLFLKFNDVSGSQRVSPEKLLGMIDNFSKAKLLHRPKACITILNMFGVELVLNQTLLLTLFQFSETDQQLEHAAIAIKEKMKFENLDRLLIYQMHRSICREIFQMTPEQTNNVTSKLLLNIQSQYAVKCFNTSSSASNQRSRLNTNVLIQQKRTQRDLTVSHVQAEPRRFTETFVPEQSMQYPPLKFFGLFGTQHVDENDSFMRIDTKKLFSA